MRTHSDSKYRPIRRCVSRYGKIEQALKRIKAESGDDEVFLLDKVVMYSKLRMRPLSKILRFTQGIDHVGTGIYKFNGKEIRVESTNEMEEM